MYQRIEQLRLVRVGDTDSSRQRLGRIVVVQQHLDQIFRLLPATGPATRQDRARPGAFTATGIAFQQPATDATAQPSTLETDGHSGLGPSA